MDIIEALKERLQDPTISKAAKDSIVQELKNKGVKQVVCTHVGFKPEPFRNDFVLDETYIVLWETRTTLVIWTGITTQRFTKDPYGYGHRECGWENDFNRTLVEDVEGK